jgi:hypothetical protein
MNAGGVGRDERVRGWGVLWNICMSQYRMLSYKDLSQQLSSNAYVCASGYSLLNRLYFWLFSFYKILLRT